MTYSLYKLPRLYLNQDFIETNELALSDSQTHYLKNVLRLNIGDRLRVFNGTQGEWIGAIYSLGKRNITLKLHENIKAQPSCVRRIHLLFAPIKKNRLDFLIEKSVELGVTDFHPILSARTENRNINSERLTFQAIEASEQSEKLYIPIFHNICSLEKKLEAFVCPVLFACVERRNKEMLSLRGFEGDVGFLIGPEGGFNPDELDAMNKYPYIRMVSLGESILRSETAALACLSIAMFE